MALETSNKCHLCAAEGMGMGNVLWDVLFLTRNDWMRITGWFFKC